MDEQSQELFPIDSKPASTKQRSPLADRMRPDRIEAFVGQEHILGKGKILREAMEQGKLFSMVLWGPPGCGKTALARLAAHYTQSHWVSFSAVLSGVKEIREVIQEAQRQWRSRGKQTVLFVDEIHRFNKAQQDAFLPHVENGTILLIGATTENPSFEINKALLSRTRVLVLHPLREDDIARIVRNAIEDQENGLGKTGLQLAPAAMDALCRAAQGDARRALNVLELAVSLRAASRPDRLIEVGEIVEALQKKVLVYDKDGEEHYDLISAFIKSLRGSDPDAALYWMVRMLEGGEDPLFIARRMVIFASEDVGNADPHALALAVAVKEAVHFVGLPEATLNLSQAATYLSCAPKSNASCLAYGKARKAVQELGTLSVPMHLRNAPTDLMKELGYSKGYQYPHDAPGAIVSEAYLPDELAGSVFYEPADRGEEKNIRERLSGYRSVQRRPKKGPPSA